MDMERLVTLLFACAVAAGCGWDSNPGVGPTSDDQASSSNSRGGTITVGEQTWTFVPSIQCSIYAGNLVSIAGHAAEDPSLEIVIDYTTQRGPVGVSVGADRREGSWFAVRDSLQWQIEGQQVRGTATFSEFRGGSGKSAEGSFDISCL
jgi:hypothetical protein